MIYRIKRLEGYPFCREFHEECLSGVVHVSWEKRVCLLGGKRKLADAEPSNLRPCDGTCGRKTGLLARALRGIAVQLLEPQ